MRIRRKKISFLTKMTMLSFILFILLLFSCQTENNNFDNKIETKMWQIKSVQGEKTITLNDLNGKVTIIHFFASWCPPCRQEFPDFINWLNKNKNNDHLALIPLSLDKSVSDADAFFSKYQTEAECYFDEGEAAESFKIKGIPATLILDKNGKVVFKREGGVNWRGGEADEVIEKIKDW